MRAALLAGVVAALCSSPLAGQQPPTAASEFPVGGILRLHLKDAPVAEVQGSITGRRDAGGCLVLDLDTVRNPDAGRIGVVLAGITRTELKRTPADTTWQDVPREAYGRNNVACLMFVSP